MDKGIPKAEPRPRRRVRAEGLLAVGAALVIGALTSVPASAQIQLPPVSPLPLPTLSPGGTLPVSQTIDGAGKLLGLVPEQLGGQGPAAGKPVPRPAVQPKGTTVDSWSLDLLPGLQGTSARTAVGSMQLQRPGSYSSLVSGGLRAAAGRAANLAGPLAAPLALALFAIGLLAIAARGPGRLVKVEEERQSYRDRQSYRL